MYLVIKRSQIVYIGTNERVAKDKARLFSSRFVIAAAVAWEKGSLTIKPVFVYIQSAIGGRFEEIPYSAFVAHRVLYDRYIYY